MEKDICTDRKIYISTDKRWKQLGKEWWFLLPCNENPKNKYLWIKYIHSDAKKISQFSKIFIIALVINT